jgi:hypothetical protein
MARRGRVFSSPFTLRRGEGDSVATPQNPTDNGSWTLAEQLLERGDSAFVAELRRITDANRLGEFAARWHADRRAASRRLLFEYLDQPLNSYRHEALVKRLFKLAEKTEDDELMARYLVAFDRTLRRRRRKVRQFLRATASDAGTARTILAGWSAQGAEHTSSQLYNNTHYLNATFATDTLQLPSGTTIPRGRWQPVWDTRTRRPVRLKDVVGIWNDGRGGAPIGPDPISDGHRKAIEERWLFTPETRRYLQRRAWRYFRKLGKRHPERYIPGVAAALKCYRDQDAADGLALIDNWGLMHILFHHSPAVEPKPSGWRPVAGHGLSELKPAPMYEPLWKESPRTLLELLKGARCRAVRQWAVFMIRRDHAALLQGLTHDDLFELLATPDAEVALLAAEVLRTMPDISVLGVDRLLGLVESPSSETLEIVCDLLGDKLGGERVSLEQALRLAMSRPLPSARLGLVWLEGKTPATETECQSVLQLADAPAEPLRGALTQWARTVLTGSPHFQSTWVLDFLDSKHADVRTAGWDWLQAEPRARDDVEIWRKLIESPYDDIRLKFVAELEGRVRDGRPAHRLEDDQLDGDLVRFLWASVLLNIHRGGRTKPVVVRQIVRRLGRNAHEVYFLLPILAAALRSLRGPEFRSGLTGIVQFAERFPELRGTIAELFPELRLV